MVLMQNLGDDVRGATLEEFYSFIVQIQYNYIN